MRFFMLELHVQDLQQSLEWYRQLGWQMELLRPENGFVLLNNDSCRLALKQDPVKRQGEYSSDSWSVRVHFEIPNLEDIMSQLAARGLLPYKTAKTSPEGYRRVIYRDPDGYEICLFQWLHKELGNG
ncbi:MAG: hypothetical protein RMI91_14050 [Gemmatales bacterium]|nr:hypothetical protein [Gemmatales bacterium]MDW7995768.1 hypothetical protein [Gemmatales bacterium]